MSEVPPIPILDTAAFTDRLRGRFATAGWPLFESAVQRLTTHAQLLAEWSAYTNLVGLNDPFRWVDELYWDSAQLLSVVRSSRPGTLVDLGSGAGFPGLVLAALLEDTPARPVRLVESVGKKCRFLTEAVAAMQLRHARVDWIRAEELGHRPSLRQRCSTVVFKALGPWAVGLELAMPLVAVGGTVAFLQGRDPPSPAALSAVTERLGGALTTVTPYRLAHAEHDRHIVAVIKTGPTARKYPRPVGVPVRKPLDRQPGGNKSPGRSQP